MTRYFPQPLLPLVLAGCTLTGCTTVSTDARPPAYYETAASYSEAPSSPLFSGDAAVLSDEAIGRILDFEYQPPALSRIAIMSFGGETWTAWSEDLAAATETMKSGVIDRLEASPSVYDASFLPSILVPESQTVPYLREAAARYQADLLLVYRSHCRSFEKYRLFAADRSRAFCGVEAVLLDTRTGLVPFTSVATRSFEAVENDADLNFRETILKAQLDAVAGALSEVSAEIAAFLSDSA